MNTSAMLSFAPAWGFSLLGDTFPVLHINGLSSFTLGNFMKHWVLFKALICFQWTTLGKQEATNHEVYVFLHLANLKAHWHMISNVASDGTGALSYPVLILKFLMLLKIYWWAYSSMSRSHLFIVLPPSGWTWWTLIQILIHILKAFSRIKSASYKDLHLHFCSYIDQNVSRLSSFGVVCKVIRRRLGL